MRWLSLVVGIGITVGLATTASADIDTTPLWDGTSALSPFGEPQTASYGQTFKVAEPETVLKSYSFWVMDDSVLSSNEADRVDFAAFVMEWDADHDEPTGPVLFESAPMVSYLDDEFHEYAINVPSLPLSPQKQYVAFFSASGFFGNGHGWANMGMIAKSKGDAYEHGDFVYANSDSGKYSFTSSRWYVDSDYNDLAFTMNVSSPVPVPGSALLGALGLAAVAWVRRRRGKVGRLPFSCR